MKLISSIIKYLFAVFLILVGGYSFYTAYKNYENPCSLPISYSIDSFDKRFGVSQSEFLKSAAAAEKAWESKVGVNLFNYNSSGGVLALNLVYDARQNATNKLGKLDSAIDDSKGSYNELKAQYQAQLTKYQNANAQYEADNAAFVQQRDAYQQEVTYWNNQGGAPEKKYQELSQEKKSLTQQQSSLDVERKNVNTLAQQTNDLAAQLNTLAKSLNIDISQYNAVGKTLDQEFDQGVYERDEKGTRINVYQFDNSNALVHVLTHEFGHALGLEHSQNENSIMYYLSEAKPQTITDDDVARLKAFCKLP